MARDVQFKGREAVIMGYNKAEIPCWSICCGKEFNFKYSGDKMEEGAETLDAWLEMMEETSSKAIYSLRLYEDPPAKIQSNTPYDCSFNFTLSETGANYVAGMPGGAAGMISKISALEKKVAELEAEEETEDFGMGKIGVMMQHPALEPLIPLLTNKLLDIFMPPKPVEQTARIAGIELPGSTFDDEKKLSNALQILRAAEPEIIPVLCKLSELAQRNPTKFKYFLSMFRGMNI